MFLISVKCLTEEKFKNGAATRSSPIARTMLAKCGSAKLNGSKVILMFDFFVSHLSQCCDCALLRLRYKYHLVRVRRTLQFALKYLLCSHKKFLEMVQL